MKAVQITQYGGPEVLEFTDVDDPVAGPGEAVVQLAASGINYMDVYGRTGLYGQGPLPTILGGEGAGTVVEVGPDVATPSVGDVVAYTGASRSYAERVVVPADRLIVLPQGITAEQGAAAMLQGMTAHYLSHSTYPLGPDDTALVHAGAGGVGLLLIQMAKMRGATVITTVSTEEKAELARGAGADHVVLYTQEDFQEAVMRITDGAGCQVAYDSVGATTYEGSMASLAIRGHLVMYGQSSGVVPPIAPLALNAKSLFLTRPSLFNYTLTRDELEWRAGDVLGWIGDGKLSLRITERFPLQDAAEAHRRLESRQTTGKLLLIP